MNRRVRSGKSHILRVLCAVLIFVILNSCDDGPCPPPVGVIEATVSDPHPPDRQEWVYRDVTLSWKVEVQPDCCEGDCTCWPYDYIARGKIWLGKTPNTMTVFATFSELMMSPRTIKYDLRQNGKVLDPYTDYYWQIELKIETNPPSITETTTKSPIWRFKTGYAFKP